MTSKKLVRIIIVLSVLFVIGKFGEQKREAEKERLSYTYQNSISKTGNTASKKTDSSSSSGNSNISNDTSDNSSSSRNSYTTSSRKSSSQSSYDEGYEAICEDDDYDEERYKTDKDYAEGVDDAMDEYDW